MIMMIRWKTSEKKKTIAAIERESEWKKDYAQEMEREEWRGIEIVVLLLILWCVDWGN